VELEAVPPPLSRPKGFISLDDPRCGALATNLANADFAFEGVDDSTYGSVFNSVYNNPADSNPYNPTTIFIPEKVWYSTAPTDALQDTVPNLKAHGLSMFELADHNYQSLRTCMAEVTGSGGSLRGVYIPPGRFFARGGLVLPSNITIQGAGMWYSKFVAVDTAAPTAADVGGKYGYAGRTGNLIFLGQKNAAGEGPSNVHLSQFSMFGNVTQRDTLDFPIPMGIHGQFTNSTVDHLWVEHYVIGINFNGNSRNVSVSDSRVRDTFADGIDFYGSTSHSTIVRSQSRSTGDDGFAIWSQGIDTTAPDVSNRITRSEAQLQWYGNGYAVYGGTNNEISFSNASDVLNYPCLQASTQFVPASLTGASMTASFAHLIFYRCGGNGFSQRFGALLVGVHLEDINGIAMRDIKIIDPTYGGIDIRPIPGNSAHQIVATINDAWFENMIITNASTCGTVNPFSGGEARLDNVCVCRSVASAPASCTLDNSSPHTFQPITIAPCNLSFCRASNQY
jgi:hypothetical protein